MGFETQRFRDTGSSGSGTAGPGIRVTDQRAAGTRAPQNLFVSRPEEPRIGTLLDLQGSILTRKANQTLSSPND
ncbi:hypothetical protein [Pseudarthrobacter sp. AB1]|uniref:hypothetical protein n=1 Tax=Pseudarthrobacter sp. AB1 TaxID=2138309 RepID=UPI00186B8F33|nr:hypothetical protein [Pseudarthrobacter sp. AB1]MBE4716587.1 hypothetical protein [Pseudarthrobacter sp. AB1]